MFNDPDFEPEQSYEEWCLERDEMEASKQRCAIKRMAREILISLLEI